MFSIRGRGPATVGHGIAEGDKLHLATPVPKDSGPAGTHQQR